MSAPDIDDDVMAHLAPLASGAHLTIVLGAGASAPSGLPEWNLFARRLAVLSGIVATDNAADILLRTQDETIVLEAAKASSGKRWQLHLNEALYGELSAEPSPSPLHLAAAGHYVSARGRTTLGTLNFDTLLEDALLAEGEELVVIGTDGVEEADAPTVHHLHGALFDDTAPQVIVGCRDYAELVADTGAWQREFLSEALKRGPLLLAGTSYRDPDIRHWLHLIMRDEKPDHPALVTIEREGLRLDREDFEAVEDALASEWESIGLSALRMQDFADVALTIRELAYISGAEYESPSDRAKGVWRAHVRGFNRLQGPYGEALTGDAEPVSDVLGAKAHRATLWLANGRGGLARWATDGVRYRGIRDLKSVPTGHDSPWIAGEAIGTEEVTLKDVDRNERVSPTWRSVLAIPVFAGDGKSPDFASAVVTFGLDKSADKLLSRRRDSLRITDGISAEWGERISAAAFPDRND